MGDGLEVYVFKQQMQRLFREDVNQSECDIKLQRIELERAETLDFVVACKDNPIGDRFDWTAEIKLMHHDNDDPDSTTWNSSDDFGGPEPQPLNGWERFIQVLLLSNEFQTID